MQHLTIPIHSFVDLITNSSSELFVCDTKKSVEAVKGIVTELAKLFNERIKFIDDSNKGWAERPISIPLLFTDVFAEPRISEFTFNLNHFPKSALWDEMFGNGNRYCEGFYSPREEHPVLAECKALWNSWEEKHPQPDYPRLDHGPEYATYQARWKKHREVEAKFFAPWHKLMLDIYTELFAWASQLNDIDLIPLGKLEAGGGEYAHVQFEKMWGPDRLDEKEIAFRFIEEVKDAIDYGYYIKKGDILLRSADDNSIPYSFWPDIESTFSCQRRHLG